MTIPLVDLVAQMAEIDADLRPGLDDVLRTAYFVGGPHVAEFESQYARFIGVRECVGVANGTDAIELALRALGVGPGDEVVLPTNTFIATAEAVARVGATSVPVDVDPTYLLMDPASVSAAVGPRTKAVVPVHLFGQVAPVEAYRAAADSVGAVILEDAAQSQGARRHGRMAGTLGSVAATSFYPGKNLGAGGDAGAVLTDDPGIARTVRLIGAHGSPTRYVHSVVGVNSRLDAIQSVVLSAKLTRLADWNARRAGAARRYAELLADVPDVRVPTSMDGNEDVWHLYVVRVPRRDHVLDKLQAEGIGAGIHYPHPVHLTDAFAHLGYRSGAFPVAETAANEILSLPLYPHITPAQQETVVDALKRALAS